MHNIGDILLRTQSYDPYDNILPNDHYGNTYMVLDSEQMVISSTMKVVTVYKLMCLETGEFFTSTASSTKTWEKLA